MNMLRLVRFILMVAIVATSFSFGLDIQSQPHNAHAACSIWVFNCDDPTQVPYCNSNDPNSDNYCGLDKGVNIVKEGITGIETERKFSEYIQDVIVYLLTFLSLIMVVLILWAGFLILTSQGDNDDAIKKGKGIIKYAIIGAAIIFLAWSITTFILGNEQTNENGLINAGVFNFTLIPKAQAAEDTRGFDYYKTRIENVTQDIGRDFEVDGRVKIVNLQELQAAVTGSMETFPDNSNKQLNDGLANAVLTAIALVRKYPDSDLYTDRLAQSLRDYITGVRIGAITAKITATPDRGNAPFTTTLRATEARDPSGVTIPDSNYVWWIRGTGGTRKEIGRGPSIGYTFQTEAVYTVNLEIISASRNSKGKQDVMSFAGTQEVRVLPKLANILLYVNGANVSTNDTYKITPNQGKAGIIIDASSSTAAAGASILKTEWDFGNGNRTNYNGGPRVERQIYANEGVYTIKLKITTNESPNGITKELRIQMNSPIASIRADKTSGYAGDEFKFQASSNASNTLLTYEWSVLEADTGKSLYSTKGQTMNYKFPRMGNYLVKLRTLATAGNDDTDNIQIRIDSKDPIANFDAKATNSETPNTYYIDASKSYDPDSLDSSKLIFNWTIDGERVQLTNSARNGALGYFTFTTKGNHTIVLDLANEQGKVTQLKKEFQVDSLLSVRLIATPKIAQLNTQVAFVAESREATVFEWDFGDGTTENTSQSRGTHAYKKAGTYDVRLTVRGNADAGVSNSIVRKVYVTDANSPFAAVSVKHDDGILEPISGVCPAGDGYLIDRTKPVRLSAEESINTDGTTNGLTYAWKYQGKTSTQREFSYKFDELGCFPITLTVRSTKSNISHSSTVYVKVENAPPTFSSMSVAADNAESDPVIVKVALNNASDPDGVIVSYLWYYYTDADPEPQDFRITKTPKTVFVVPRIDGKYYFAVTMEDSNGAKVNTEEVREERYSITLASDNINTPLITLKTSASEQRVGDEITFQVTVKNIIGQDLTDKAEYKWDFDGDGFYDQTTSKPTVSYTYSKPGSFNMKVKASYRGISNTRFQQIIIRNDLQPNLEYFAIGNRYVFMNTTQGMFTKVKWTVGENTSDNRDSYVVNLDEGSSVKEVRLEVSDGIDTKVTNVPLRKDVVNANKIKNSTDALVVLTYPAIDGSTITVENPNDPIYIYLGESRGVSRYEIDTDIKTDSNLNGEGADDVDNKGTDSFVSGAPFVLKNLSALKERTMKVTIYDAAGKSLGSQNIALVLSYINDAPAVEEIVTAVGLSDADKAGIETLKDLIRTKSPEADRVRLMQQVSLLQEVWPDATEKTKTIIDIQQYIAELPLKDEVKNEFFTVLDSFLLSDSETKDEIGLAVSVLRKLIPGSNPKYEEIFGKDGKGGLVGEILSHPTNVELNREIGEKILSYIKDDSNIEDGNKFILKEQLRVIINGGSKNLPSTPSEVADESESGAISLLKNVAVAFAWIIGIVLFGLVVLFVIFKITSRNSTMEFQDFLIEKIFGGGNSSASEPFSSKATAINVDSKITSAAPLTPVAPPVQPTMTDPLGNSLTNEVSTSQIATPVYESKPTDTLTSVEGVVSPETTESTEEIAIPDWLKDGTSKFNEPSVQENNTSIEPLVGLNQADTLATEEIENVQVIQADEPTEESEPTEVDESTKESESTEAGESQEQTPIEPEEVISPVSTQEDEITSVRPSFLETIQEDEEALKNTNTDDFEVERTAELMSTNDAMVGKLPKLPQDDLPDWLKGMSTNTDSEAPKIAGEEKSQVSKTKSGNSKKANATKNDTISREEESLEKNNTTQSSNTPTVNTDDLPDWLK